MRWTKELPKKSGFYWIKPRFNPPHYQGPIVIDVEVDNNKVFLCSPGGDYVQTIEEFEENEAKIEAWSDEFIQIPLEIA